MEATQLCQAGSSGSGSELRLLTMRSNSSTAAAAALPLLKQCTARSILQQQQQM
jgi:hypothetical protein